MNKRKLILIITTLSLALFLNFIYFTAAPAYLSKKISKEGVKNQFLTEKERMLCKENCLKVYLEKTIAGINEQSLASNIEQNTNNQEVMKAALAKKNYLKLVSLYTKEVEAFSESFAQYEEINNFSKEDIIKQSNILGENIIFKREDYRLTNFHSQEGYLILELIPTEGLTDAAILILERSNGGYRHIAGPGTYFEQSNNKKLPTEVLEYANNRLAGAEKLDPLLKHLPYNSSDNKFFVDYADKSDKIIYEVTIYTNNTKEVEAIKKEAATWILSKTKSLGGLEIIYTLKPIKTPIQDYLE